MNAADRKFLIEVQDFLLEHVMQDATAVAHHRKAEELFARLHTFNHRSRENMQHFETWRASPENTVKDSNQPELEAMVYCGLFPGRTYKLLAELL